MKNSRNPPWSRDELILALDLYLDLKSVPNANHPEIVSLSKILNALSIHQTRPNKEKFRNPNGVCMKLSNFLSQDPSYKGVGLQRGGRLEKEIWSEFSGDREQLRKIAQAIKDTVKDAALNEDLSLISVDEDAEALEGRILQRMHKSRERNAGLVKKKKALMLEAAGRLFCEVCGFDFEDVYGDLGQGFMEAHHLKPLSELKPNQKTKLEDLALICANCHRMVHRKKVTLGVHSLKKMVMKGKS